jgi:SAM-dependent methyltransferase
MTPEEARALVRRGYDAVSEAYRDDAGGGEAADREKYLTWAAEIAALTPRGGRVVDLGCGCGVPATAALVDHGLDVVGVDFSPVQIARARRLVPGASFVEADLAGFDLEPASVDAVVSFYALIHVPLVDQRSLFPRLAGWLRPGGHALLVVGAHAWQGVEDYLGTEMFWEHGGTDDYLRWLADAGLDVVRHEYVPEGDSGHALVLTRRR